MGELEWSITPKVSGGELKAANLLNCLEKPGLLRANAQKNRANRGHSSKPNLPSFSVCNKVLMSL